MCGGDAEIYFLRGTDYKGAYDYPAYVTKLTRLDLTTGFEEQILLTPENEITPEVGSLTHGDLSRAKSIDKDFRGYPDENDLMKSKGLIFLGWMLWHIPVPVFRNTRLPSMGLCISTIHGTVHFR